MCRHSLTNLLNRSEKEKIQFNFCVGVCECVCGCTHLLTHVLPFLICHHWTVSFVKLSKITAMLKVLPVSAPNSHMYVPALFATLALHIWSQNI